MTSILHTSDIHLRDRQYHRADRADDFEAAMQHIVDIAIKEEVAAILISGDLLDVNRPSPRTMRFLLGVDARLRKAKIPCYVANGDHDKTDPPWMAVVEDARSDKSPGGLRVLCNEQATIPGTDLTVYGLDFIGKSKERFMEIKDTIPSADILMWHTMVKELMGFPVENAVSLEELPTDRFSFIALGDIHVRQYRRHDATGCWIGYPGSTELCKGDEPLQKSVSLVEFDDAHKVTEVLEIPLKTRKAFFYRLTRAEEVDIALLEVAAAKELNPIVVGRYNPHLPGVVQRFYDTLDPDKAIIRLTALPENELDAPIEEDEEMENRPIEDFLPEFFRAGSKLYVVAEACCRPDAPVADLINQYVESVEQHEAIVEAVI